MPRVPTAQLIGTHSGKDYTTSGLVDSSFKVLLWARASDPSYPPRRKPKCGTDIEIHV